jgi:hypothetical protein
MSNYTEGPVQAQPEPSPSPAPDHLAWVREAIDGLRHSQNIMLGSVAAGFALMLAVMGFMITEIQSISGDMQSMEQRIVRDLGTRIDSLDAKVTDTRERVIRLEERTAGISEQLAKFQRGALEPGFGVEPDPATVPNAFLQDPKLIFEEFSKVAEKICRGDGLSSLSPRVRDFIVNRNLEEVISLSISRSINYPDCQIQVYTSLTDRLLGPPVSSTMPPPEGPTREQR